MTKGKNISLADRVFEKIENDILSEKYKPGEILTELQLSKELGVSRTPIREAIRRLEQEELLKYLPKGEMVVGISDEELRDIYEIRISLEGKAVYKAAEVITDEQLGELEKIVELQEFYTAKSNADSIKNMDSAFHKYIYDVCPSSAYKSTLTLLHKKIQKYRKVSVQNGDRAKSAAAEHREIFNALKERNPEKAGKLAEIHIINAEKNILGEK